jgi:hypothetical protein
MSIIRFAARLAKNFLHMLFNPLMDIYIKRRIPPTCEIASSAKIFLSARLIDLCGDAIAGGGGDKKKNGTKTPKHRVFV